MQVSKHQDAASLRQALALHPGLIQSERSHFFHSLGWFELMVHSGYPPTEAPIPSFYLVVSADGSRALCLAMRGSPAAQSLTNYYTGFFAPMEWHLSPQADPVFRTQAVEKALGLALASGSSIHPLRFEALEGDGWFYQSLAAAAPVLGRTLLPSPGFANWYLNVAGRRAAELFAALPSRLRHTIERANKRLNADGEWGVTIASDNLSGLDQAVKDFVQVYGHSWKSAEPNPAFIPSLVQLAVEFPGAGVRVGVLRVHGRPVAAQLWMLCRGTAYIFKLAQVEEPVARSLGSVLTERMLQHVVDVDGVLSVDFLSGDDAYKKDWMSARRCRTDAILAHRFGWTRFKHALLAVHENFK